MTGDDYLAIEERHSATLSDAIEAAVEDLKEIAEDLKEGVEAGEGLVWLVPTLDEALKAHDLVVSDRKDDLAAIKAVIADLEKAI